MTSAQNNQAGSFNIGAASFVPRASAPASSTPPSVISWNSGGGGGGNSASDSYSRGRPVGPGGSSSSPTDQQPSRHHHNNDDDRGGGGYRRHHDGGRDGGRGGGPPNSRGRGGGDRGGSDRFDRMGGGDGGGGRGRGGGDRERAGDRRPFIPRENEKDANGNPLPMFRVQFRSHADCFYCPESLGPDVKPGDYVIVSGDRGYDAGIIVGPQLPLIMSTLQRDKDNLGLRLDSGSGSGMPRGGVENLQSQPHLAARPTRGQSICSIATADEVSELTVTRQQQADEALRLLASLQEDRLVMLGKLPRDHKTPGLPQVLESDRMEIDDVPLEVMEFVDVEFQFDLEKIIIYFRADNKVTFSKLAKLLHKHFRCRVWMHNLYKPEPSTFWSFGRDAGTRQAGGGGGDAITPEDAVAGGAAGAAVAMALRNKDADQPSATANKRSAFRLGHARSDSERVCVERTLAELRGRLPVTHAPPRGVPLTIAPLMSIERPGDNDMRTPAERRCPGADSLGIVDISKRSPAVVAAIRNGPGGGGTASSSFPENRLRPHHSRGASDDVIIGDSVGVAGRGGFVVSSTAANAQPIVPAKKNSPSLGSIQAPPAMPRGNSLTSLPGGGGGGGGSGHIESGGFVVSSSARNTGGVSNNNVNNNSGSGSGSSTSMEDPNSGAAYLIDQQMVLLTTINQQQEQQLKQQQMVDNLTERLISLQEERRHETASLERLLEEQAQQIQKLRSGAGGGGGDDAQGDQEQQRKSNNNSDNNSETAELKVEMGKMQGRIKELERENQQIRQLFARSLVEEQGKARRKEQQLNDEIGKLQQELAAKK